jgi:hypothetical protein
MKILLGVGFAFRIALLCLLAGFALGLYIGIRATGEVTPTSGAALPGHVFAGPAPVHPPGREVPPWRRTPSSSFSAGSSASSAE